MTKAEREKVIDLLDNLRGMIEDNQGNDYDFALKKGIEALEQEDCEDAVSRQAVSKFLENCTKDFEDARIRMTFKAASSLVKNTKYIPPVTPVACIATIKISKEDMRELVGEKVKELTGERKKGFWINTNDYITTAYGTIDYVKCSCCGEECLEEGDYCPNCGSFMKGEFE